MIEKMIEIILLTIINSVLSIPRKWKDEGDRKGTVGHRNLIYGALLS
jgi:hypothetical protein